LQADDTFMKRPFVFEENRYDESDESGYLQTLMREIKALILEREP